MVIIRKWNLRFCLGEFSLIVKKELIVEFWIEF